MFEKEMSENNMIQKVRHRWRDELVSRLLPYMKEGVDAKTLNNVVRRYMPDFYPTKLDYDEGGRWIFPISLSRDYWWEREIEKIGKEFAKDSGLDDPKAKEIFRNYGWETDKLVENIGVLDKRLRWTYDAYKDKVAVEVELSDRSQVYKDAFKFLIGQATETIDVGIVMVRYKLKGKNCPYFKNVDYDSHPIFTVLPMLKIAFHGF